MYICMYYDMWMLHTFHMHNLSVAEFSQEMRTPHTRTKVFFTIILAANRGIFQEPLTVDETHVSYVSS
jgi:hypothetical protein